MTAEEIVAQIDAGNRVALKAAGGIDSGVIMDWLNEAGMRGFRMGSNATLAVMEGAIAVKLASIDKPKTKE